MGSPAKPRAAALDWAVAEHDPARVIAHVVAENVASVEVARALGLEYVADTEFYGEPCQLYATRRR